MAMKGQPTPRSGKVGDNWAMLAGCLKDRHDILGIIFSLVPLGWAVSAEQCVLTRGKPLFLGFHSSLARCMA